MLANGQHFREQNDFNENIMDLPQDNFTDDILTASVPNGPTIRVDDPFSPSKMHQDFNDLD